MNATIATLMKLLKGMDEGYPDSVTQSMRREFRETIRPLYGDDYMLEVIRYEVEEADIHLRALEEYPGDCYAEVAAAKRDLKYLRKIYRKLDAKWREWNNILMGHCGMFCNFGCPECAPGGYEHASEV
jgi:hypothetical protein